MYHSGQKVRGERARTAAAGPEVRLVPAELQLAITGRSAALTRSAVHAVQRLAGNAAAARLVASRSAVRRDEAPVIQRAAATGAGCSYERGEVARSRTGAGLLARDVGMPQAHPDARPHFDPVSVADFAVGESAVKASTAAELTSGAWISIIEQQAPKKLEFVGFTDCVGAESTNATLRQRRAESVAALFPAARRMATSIAAAPGGDQIGDAKGMKGRAANRAVLIRAPRGAAPTPKPKTPAAPARPKPEVRAAADRGRHPLAGRTHPHQRPAGRRHD